MVAVLNWTRVTRYMCRVAPVMKPQANCGANGVTVTVKIVMRTPVATRLQCYLHCNQKCIHQEMGSFARSQVQTQLVLALHHASFNLKFVSLYF